MFLKAKEWILFRTWREHSLTVPELTTSQVQELASDAQLRYAKVEKEKELIQANDKWSKVTIIMGWDWEMLCNLWFQVHVYIRRGTKIHVLLFRSLGIPSFYAIISGAFLHRPHLQGKWEERQLEKKGGNKTYLVKKIYFYHRFYVQGNN